MGSYCEERQDRRNRSNGGDNILSGPASDILGNPFFLFLGSESMVMSTTQLNGDVNGLRGAVLPPAAGVPLCLVGNIRESTCVPLSEHCPKTEHVRAIPR